MDVLTSTNSFDPDNYSHITNSCVTVCENALQDAGILENEPGPETITTAGETLQAGAPQSFRPSSLANQLRASGKTQESKITGTRKASRLRAFINSLRIAIGLQPKEPK